MDAFDFLLENHGAEPDVEALQKLFDTPIKQEPREDPIEAAAPPLADIPLPPILVSNVVCKGSVGCDIDLDHCQPRIKNCHRQKFPALFIGMQHVRLLLFSTGRVLATGACTYEKNLEAFSKLVTALRMLGYNKAVLGPVSIENIVANFEMGHEIQISKLAADPYHARYCQTQDKFPCINYRLVLIQPRVTLRIFSSGKVICQAAKSLEDVHGAVRYIIPVLYHFRQRRHDPVDPRTLVVR